LLFPMSPQREYPDRPIVGVGVLIKKADKYLLIKRAANPDKGLWSVPGGLIEVGERAKDAAVREALEETGLEVELIERLGVVDKIEYDAEGEVLYHFVILQFLAVPVSGVIKPMDDALDAVWVTLEQLKDYQITGSLERFLRDIGLYPD
jgi:8-oxo-dGTP diphosphatase